MNKRNKWLGIQLSEKELAKFKKLCDKHDIKYKTEEEYVKSAQALCTFVYHCIPPGTRTRTTDNKKASRTREA